jgi:hypothetical protein
MFLFRTMTGGSEQQAFCVNWCSLAYPYVETTYFPGYLQWYDAAALLDMMGNGPMTHHSKNKLRE